MDRTKNLFSRAVGFTQRDIWRIRVTELPPGKSFFINVLPFAHTPAFAALSNTLASFGEAVERMPENRPLKELGEKGTVV